MPTYHVYSEYHPYLGKQDRQNTENNGGLILLAQAERPASRHDVLQSSQLCFSTTLPNGPFLKTRLTLSWAQTMSRAARERFDPKVPNASNENKPISSSVWSFEFSESVVAVIHLVSSQQLGTRRSPPARGEGGEEPDHWRKI